MKRSVTFWARDLWGKRRALIEQPGWVLLWAALGGVNSSI